MSNREIPCESVTLAAVAGPAGCELPHSLSPDGFELAPLLGKHQLSAMARHYLGGCCIGEWDELRSANGSWSADAGTRQRGVHWRMKIDHAHGKLETACPRITP